MRCNLYCQPPSPPFPLPSFFIHLLSLHYSVLHCPGRFCLREGRMRESPGILFTPGFCLSPGFWLSFEVRMEDRTALKLSFLFVCFFVCLFFIFYFILFYFKHLYWSIIALQWCVSFCFITK